MKKNSLIRELISLYDGQHGYVSFYVRVRRRLLKLDYYSEILPPNGVVIDVGCGYGVMANYLSLCAPDRQVMGIDLSSKRISTALKTIGDRKNISFLTQDAARWAWPSCTGISMTDFLHHVYPTEQEMVLSNAFQSLQKDGVLLISEVDPTANPSYRYWVSYLSDRVLYPLSKTYFRKPNDWANALSCLGFNVKIIKLWNPIFGGVLFVCQK
jgi:ubiquinone/menaquinone biosynthesis C-methylase UbiE